MTRFSILVFICLFGIHFYIRNRELDEYYKFEGKVVGFEKITITSPSFSGVRVTGRIAEDKVIPVVEYTNSQGEKITYEDGNRVLFSNFELNEKVQVLENKKNQFKTKIYSFFYFWFYLYDLITILLIAFILIFGYYVFVYLEKINKKKSREITRDFL